MDLKRDIVKYIRDKAKNKYEKGTECYICGSSKQLDFHHFYSLSPLVHKWVKTNELLPENVLSFREDFIEQHWAEFTNIQSHCAILITYNYIRYMVETQNSQVQKNSSAG